MSRDLRCGLSDAQSFKRIKRPNLPPFINAKSQQKTADLALYLSFAEGREKSIDFF